MKPNLLPTENTETVLPFRNPDMLYELSKAFEQRWADYQEAVMSYDPQRPDVFPRIFKSRWDMAWHLRTLSDEEALQLLRVLQEDPARLVQPFFARQRTEAVVNDTHADAKSAMTPQQVIDAGFPRIWRASA